MPIHDLTCMLIGIIAQPLWSCTDVDLISAFFFQLLSPLPDVSVVKSLQLLAWSAACGDISLAQDASTIHQYFLKVAICLCTRDWKWLV